MSKHIFRFTFSLAFMVLFSQLSHANTHNQSSTYSYANSQVVNVNALSRVVNFAPKEKLTLFRTTLGHKFKRKTAHRLQYVKVKAFPTANIQNIAAVRYNSYTNSIKNYWP